MCTTLPPGKMASARKGIRRSTSIDVWRMCAMWREERGRPGASSSCVAYRRSCCSFLNPENKASTKNKKNAQGRGAPAVNEAASDASILQSCSARFLRLRAGGAKEAAL
jgi:hypothetical protein